MVGVDFSVFGQVIVTRKALEDVTTVVKARAPMIYQQVSSYAHSCPWFECIQIQIYTIIMLACTCGQVHVCGPVQ